MIAYLQILWHHHILGHWQQPRINGAEAPAVICGCGVVWEGAP